MARVKERISICTWVQKLKPGGTSMLLLYNAPGAKSEILMYDASNNFYMLGKETYTVITAPLNEWHHQCLTWSFATKTTKFYYNGKLLKSANTSSGRKLTIGGSIAIGQAHKTTTLEADFYGYGNFYSFGGEIHDFNIFTEQLTDKEVSEMYGSGMCSKYVESLSQSKDIMFLKWDDLLYELGPLTTNPHFMINNVKEFSMTQCPSLPSEESNIYMNLPGNFTHGGL